VHVAGQDRLCAAYGHHDEVGVDDVAGTRARQQTSEFGSVVESDNDHRLQKSLKACLSSTIAPHLGDDGMRRGQWRLVDERGGEEFLRSAFTSIDRDEERGVKNQDGIGGSWPRPRVRRPGLPHVPSLREDRRGLRAVGFRRRAGEARREVRSIGRHGSRPTHRACARHRGPAERWSSPCRLCSTNVLRVVCGRGGPGPSTRRPPDSCCTDIACIDGREMGERSQRVIPPRLRDPDRRRTHQLALADGGVC
jgi:hypothetical protein